MKVVCRINNVADVPQTHVRDRLRKYIHLTDGDDNLVIGRVYTVYGLHFWDNCPWFLICEYDDDEYPVAQPPEFFDMVDDRLSAYWKLSSSSREGREAWTQLVFDEWARDPLFYERLLDGHKDDEAVFARYKKLMDEE